MAKQNSFIRRAARWVARMFGYKAENKYARGVWYVFATCAAIITLYVAVVLTIVVVEEADIVCSNLRYRCKTNSPTYLHAYDNQYVSPYVIYHDDCPSYLYNTIRGRRTLTGIHWICTSSDGDSLTCFSTIKEHKRGYFNRYTGEVAIPEQYTKAWVFSEDLACVMDKGELRFIDHKGNQVIDKTFPYTPCIDEYCFHNGLCLMSDDNGKKGLIDKQGNWAVEPEYSEILYEPRGFWLIQDRELNYGLLNAKGEMLLPVMYERIIVHQRDSCIYVRGRDYLEQVLDYECNIINPCDFEEVEKLEYYTDEYDEYYNLRSATANCLRYVTSDENYGLMDRNGNIITPPSYFSITAIGPDRYLCNGTHGSVILDSKGKECGEKL